MPNTAQRVVRRFSRGAAVHAEHSAAAGGSQVTKQHCPAGGQANHARAVVLRQDAAHAHMDACDPCAWTCAGWHPALAAVGMMPGTPMAPATTGGVRVTARSNVTWTAYVEPVGTALAAVAVGFLCGDAVSPCTSAPAAAAARAPTGDFHSGWMLPYGQAMSPQSVALACR